MMIPHEVLNRGPFARRLPGDELKHSEGCLKQMFHSRQPLPEKEAERPMFLSWPRVVVIAEYLDELSTW